MHALKHWRKTGQPSYRGRSSLFFSLIVAWLVVVVTAYGQASSGEHGKHHPGQAQGSEAQSKPANPGPGGGMMGGGMGGGKMDGMMKKMGAPKPKELYPKLMDLPDLPMEQRAEIRREAHQRMMAGTTLLSEGLGKLSQAAVGDDFAAMQDATATMREGLAQFESGLAAHRAIAEGKAPRNVALKWFKREMNLLPPTSSQAGFSFFGMTAFHTGIMAVLVIFTAAMVWMYFFKMRRASALLEHLVADGPGDTGTPANTAVVSPRPPTAPAAPVGSPVSERPARKQAGSLRVSRIFQETPHTKTFRFENVDGGPIPFDYHPGQFLTLTVSPDDKPVKRSYTIASSPTQRHYCEITVKREDRGVVSRFLHDHVQEGSTLEAVGPSGKFTFTGREADSIVLIGGGVGITPLMSVVRYLTDISWGKDIFLLYSCRTLDDVIFRHELEYLKQRHVNLHVVITLTRTDEEVPGFHKGRLTKALIAESVPDIASRRIHICGAPSLMDATKSLLVDLGIPDERIKTESFGPPKKEKRAAAPQPSPSRPAAAAATVTFQESGKSGPLSPEETVLDVADAVGIDIENSCRVGSCGSCVVKLLTGKVAMECEDGLDPDEKGAGMILACQAKSTGDVTVEA